MSAIDFSTGGFGALQEFDGAEVTPGPSNIESRREVAPQAVGGVGAE